MNSLPDEDIIKFLKDNIQPLDDNAYGLGYRASATLKDGTFLPCVIFRNPATLINRSLYLSGNTVSVKIAPSIISSSSNIELLKSHFIKVAGNSL